MRPPLTSPRFTTLITGISALALLLPITAPHSHEKSAFQQASRCQAFCVQDGWAADAATATVIAYHPVVVATCRLLPSEAPLVTLAFRPTAPRAPPISS